MSIFGARGSPETAGALPFPLLRKTLFQMPIADGGRAGLSVMIRLVHFSAKLC